MDRLTLKHSVTAVIERSQALATQAQHLSERAHRILHGTRNSRHHAVMLRLLGKMARKTTKRL